MAHCVWMVLCFASMLPAIANSGIAVSKYAQTKQIHSEMRIYWSIEGENLLLGVEVSTFTCPLLTMKDNLDSECGPLRRQLQEDGLA